MAEYGFLQEVRVDPRTTSLTVAAAVDDVELVVDDAGDFDEDGGTLELNGVQIDYTGIVWGTTEDDDDTIVLASALATAADVDDELAPVIGGFAAEDWYAVIDASGGGAIHVPILLEQRHAWPEGQYDPPVPVTFAEDLSRLEDAPGRPATASRSAAYNLDSTVALDDDATVTLPLTYRPQVNGIEVKQNGVDLLPAEFSVDDQIVTIDPSAGVVVRDGDRFSAFYLYDAGAAALVKSEPEPGSEYDAAVKAEPTLLGYWRLAEASGSVMEDSSGHGHHGTYSADVSLGASSLLVGDPDTSAHFVGSGFAARGVVPFGSWMNVSEFTVECWMAMEPAITGQMYLVDRDTNARSWMLLTESGGNNAHFENIGGAGLSGVSTLGDHDEHYVVATYGGGTAKIYVDGALINSAAMSGPPAVAADLAIGGGFAGDASWWVPYYFYGRLGKVALYEGAQSAAAILNRWQIGAGL